MKHTLLCTVDRLDDQLVHVHTPDGQVFALPLSAVHGTPVPQGTIRVLGVVTDGGAVDESVFAKTILNELLSPPLA